MNAGLSQIWPRPTIVPLPLSTRGVQSTIISLNGVWKINIHPPVGYWTNAIDPTSWVNAVVPCSTITQGFEIEPDCEYAYRTTFDIPVNFAGQTIFLRFDGVNCLARVWVNGSFVREHYGGFTSWDCDITGLVTPGQPAALVVGVTDKPQEISSFHSGGIIRDVKVVALPPDHLTRLHVETDLDSEYCHATLKVTASCQLQHRAGTVRLGLRDPQGKSVPITPAVIEISQDQPEASLAIEVATPQKWDAEHPNLYTLEAALVVEGGEVETLVKQVGFRKIEVAGNRLLVNGQKVKLRGVNRHDIYPTTGRTITPELAEQDVRTFRAANINFVRTSHYPPRSDFLDACDRLGMYVEDEIAVAFVYQFIRPTQNDPEFTPAYMNQFAEMIERDRSHPCVLMWSLANESYWGRNFQLEYEYAKQADPTRPVIFSYPITIPDGVRGCDIWSLHYGDWDHNPASRTDNFSIGEAWGHDMPVLHDEYIHIPCYDFPEQMRDTAVREFWGESIKRFWESIFQTEGALGGAIWASIDEVMVTSKPHWVAEWGIVDGWRRKKPEYWLTQKAYSPIRIAEEPLENPGEGKILPVAIRNWFDHTNLQEITIHWMVGSEMGIAQSPDIEPHTAGILEIASRNWQDGEIVNLKFYAPEERLVDEYNLRIGPEKQNIPSTQGPTPTISEDDHSFTISGEDFQVQFSKQTGLITQGKIQGVQVITGGPFLNLIGIELAPWSLRNIVAHTEALEAVVKIAGSYGPVLVCFEVHVDGHGLITTQYTLEDIPYHSPRARKFNVGVDVGGYREVGVAYTLSNAVDRLAWERKGLWSAYPIDHIGRASGLAWRDRSGGDESFGVRPTWAWKDDLRDYWLFGRYDVGERGTKDFCSMKHNIWQAAALLTGTQIGVQAESDATDAVRLEVLPPPGAKIDDRDPVVHFVGTWLAVDGDQRTYQATEHCSNKAGDYVELTFHGTGIAWIGSKDLIHGIADVYLDGVLAAGGLDLYSGIGLGSSRGEEKVYQQVLFSQEGLPEGEHVIRVVVTGRHNPRASNAYVTVDAFLVLGDFPPGDIRMNINNAWNYPELTWGNYVKPPVMVETGYSNRVRIRLLAV